LVTETVFCYLEKKLNFENTAVLATHPDVLILLMIIALTHYEPGERIRPVLTGSIIFSTN